MKKIFLFLAISSLALTACSSDDDNGSSDVVKFTVDGTTKTFRNVVVVHDTAAEVYDVSASNSNGEAVTFELPDGGVVGTNKLYFVGYTAAGDGFASYDGDGLQSTLETNDGQKLKGTFSGTFYLDTDSNVTKTVTNGSFKVSY